MTNSECSAGWAAYYETLRDRPPRSTLLAALDKFSAAPPSAHAVDLGCGDGRDVVEMLRRGWKVTGVDAEPAAIDLLRTRVDLPPGADLTPVVSRFERFALPRDVHLVNSSFALPLCESADFRRLWDGIRSNLRSGGRFSGQWYGDRDSWRGRPGITFVTRREAQELLGSMVVELFEEEEDDRVTPRGKPKHWHIFHIVARKP